MDCMAVCTLVAVVCGSKPIVATTQVHSSMVVVAYGQHTGSQ